MAATPEEIISNLNAIYQQELGRAPDTGGLNFYAGEAAKGASLDEIRSIINRSDEGRAFDQATVTNLYQQELGRRPDEGGFNYYVGQLQQGALDPTTLQRTINFSDEGKRFDQTMAARAIQEQLGITAPEPTLLNQYTQQLQTGTPYQNLVGQLNASEQGRAYDLNTLKTAYQGLFNRDVTQDTEGMNYWLGRMKEDPSINQSTLMKFLEGGRKGADVTKQTAPPVTTAQVTPVPSGQVRFDTTQANQVIPQTIGPGGGMIEQQIREGVLPQRVVIGGAPLNISGGYGAYPYGITSLANRLSEPSMKMRSVAEQALVPGSLVAAPQAKANTAGLSFTPLTTPTTAYSNIAAPTFTNQPVMDFYGNPLQGPYTPATYAPPFGGAIAPGGVSVRVPEPIYGATTTAPAASPNAVATQPA
jgi:hypothetical protein